MGKASHKICGDERNIPAIHVSNRRGKPHSGQELGPLSRIAGCYGRLARLSRYSSQMRRIKCTYESWFSGTYLVISIFRLATLVACVPRRRTADT
jgi:hypothetical protein